MLHVCAMCACFYVYISHTIPVLFQVNTLSTVYYYPRFLEDLSLTLFAGQLVKKASSHMPYSTIYIPCVHTVGARLCLNVGEQIR